VSSMLTSDQNSHVLAYAYGNISWTVIIAAFGLQAMGRVMAQTVPMQAEIDATV
jgi:hypothetical protein